MSAARTMGAGKSEARNPKSETNPNKLQIKKPKPMARFGFRIWSLFGFASDFEYYRQR
jgi:hypothetical protein